MFEMVLPDPGDLRPLTDSALISAIQDSSRAAAAADARTSAAVAELVRRRVVDEHPDWACDDWDACAAEVACALTVSHGRASGLMDDAVTVRDRLPLVGRAHLAGRFGARAVGTICDRTALVTDPAARAAIDAELADAATRFGPLSQYRLERAIDAIVARHDPAAVRRSRNTLRGRNFTIGDRNDETGTASVWGRLSGADAALLHEAIRSLVASVCAEDPRTLAQRRADAVGALAARAARLPCRCGGADCLAGTGEDEVAARFVVHILADPAGLAEPADPEMHGGIDFEHGPDGDDPEGTGRVDPNPDDPRPGPGPQGPQGPSGPRGLGGGQPAGEAGPGGTSAAPVARPRPAAAALIPGLPRGGLLPAGLLADLIARGAKVRVLEAPVACPESGYRLSATLDRFVRARDVTCRFPGCDQPAVSADIDHTVPWPAGATHPSNVKAYCRKHHLVKTFWPGWSDRQDPDGSLTVTTPSGHSYTTKPAAGLLFPSFSGTTAPPPPVTGQPPPSPARGRKMPKRRQSRTKARAHRIRAERALNDADPDTPPF